MVDTHGDTGGAAEREEAKAFSELELNGRPTDHCVVRQRLDTAAKGHEIDPESPRQISDGFRFALANQLPTVVLDSTGRAYTLPTHQLPRRGAGEPLTGRINPPSARLFVLLTGAEDDRFLLASDVGYGFVVQFGQLQAKNSRQSGLTLPENARFTQPRLRGGQNSSLSWRPTRGVGLSAGDLPELARGKGG